MAAGELKADVKDGEIRRYLPSSTVACAPAVKIGNCCAIKKPAMIPRNPFYCGSLLLF
jgi:hypothetical protein